MTSIAKEQEGTPPADATLNVGDAGCAAVVQIYEVLKSLSPGQILEVIATDPTTSYDLEPWARLSGHEFLGVVSNAGAFHMFVRRGPEA